MRKHDLELNYFSEKAKVQLKRDSAKDKINAINDL